MIPIGELQIGNWVEHQGKFRQISLLMRSMDSVLLKGYDYSVKCDNIAAIDIFDNATYIQQQLSLLPNGTNACLFACNNQIEKLHELQNKCKDATNIKL